MIQRSALHTLAKTHDELAQTDLALSHYRRALDLQTRVYGADHTNTTTTWLQLGVFYYRHDELDEAMECFQKVWTVRKDQLGSGHRSTAVALYHMGRVYAKRYQMQKADKCFARVSSVLGTKRLAEPSLKNAEILSTMAHAKALIRKEEKHKQGSPSPSPSLFPSYHRESLVAATTLYQQSLSHYNQVLDKDDPHQVSVWLDCGRVYLRLGDHDQAVRCYDTAMAIASTRPSLVAAVHLARGDAHAVRGDVTAATQSYARVEDPRSEAGIRHRLELCRWGKDVLELCRWGRDVDDNGESDAVLPAWRRLYEEPTGSSPNYGDIVRTLYDMGRAYETIEYWEEAKRRYEQALRVWEDGPTDKPNPYQEKIATKLTALEKESENPFTSAIRFLRNLNYD